MKLLKTTTPIARKDYICHTCGKAIPKGEKYLSLVYTDNGKMDRHCLHLTCNDTQAKEDKFRQAVKADTQRMIETFSFKESMKIALLPLIITEMAWSYTTLVLNYCAEHKVSKTIKLSRTLKNVRSEYVADIRKDMNQKNIDQIISETLRFMKLNHQTFTQMWFQIDQCIKNQWDNTSDVPMVVNAQIALLLLGLLDKNEEQIKKLILEKVGSYHYTPNQKTEALRKALEAYNKYEVKYSAHVENCMKIIEIKLNQIDYNVV